MIKALRFLTVPVLIGLVVGLGLLLLDQAQLHLEQSSQGNGGYANAVTKAAPAVVNIYTTQMRSTAQSDDELLDRFLGAPKRARVLSSLGSGVIVSSDGYLLTSHHVIQDADEIIVSLVDGRESIARIVGVDPETDLALLRINLQGLPFIKTANANPVRVGDVVLAIGNPLGVGQTVSMGIVSATGRSHLGIATFENFIQTDAAINQGNSGGALVDTKGNLVGINTAILSQTGNWQGIGFATPVSVANEVMNNIIEHGRVIRGWLGVTVQDITPALAATFGLPEANGGFISEIWRQGPADAAGVRAGDVLIGINGNKVKNGYEAMNLIAGTAPGNAVELNLVRNQERLDLIVTIGTRPQQVEIQ